MSNPTERPHGPERRVAHAAVRVERRADKPGGKAAPRIVGHAAVYGQWTTLYEGRYWVWREKIAPGAFSRAIKEDQDVRALWNHDANFVLGRTRSGTLKLREDDTGLLTDTTPPDTQTVRDLVLTPMERGDVDGMSFAFLPLKGDKVVRTEDEDGTVTIDSGGERVTLRYEGEKLIEERVVMDADLFDVSPVTYPAYQGTDVGLRAVGPDIETRAREKDRPHRRPAPKRDEVRRWLNTARSGGVTA